MDWDAILAAVPNDLAAADGDAEAAARPGPGAAAINPAVAASAPRRLGIFLGALNRSKAHMVFVRSAKDLKRAAAQSENFRHAFSGLKRAWDGQCVRVGDTAAGPEDVCEQRHMNQYLSEAVLRLAYRGVGKGGGGVVGRDGFDGTHSAMPLMCGVASASLNSQTEAMGKWWREFQTEADSKGALVVNLHYDTTPWRVGFGAFFDLLHPHARYVIKDSTTNRYTLVPFEAYAKMFPKARCTKGVLEFLAQVVAVCPIAFGTLTYALMDLPR